MSLGSAGRPSTTTVDPTPPALRPIQQQLAAMMSARLQGQGRASVPTYGQGMPNILSQLYGMNPRTGAANGAPLGGGVPPTPYTPWGPQPDPMRPPIRPLTLGAQPTAPSPNMGMPSAGITLPNGGMPDPVTPTPLGSTLQPPPPTTRPLVGDMPPIQPPSQPMVNPLMSPQQPYVNPFQVDLGGLTRGGPMGMYQGSNYTGPYQQLPTYDPLNSGSRLMYAMNNLYGSY
jgi:hypothetical protein